MTKPHQKILEHNPDKGILIGSNIGFAISGINCDHCEYKNDDVAFEEYPSWLNKPCPDCGATLLTEQHMVEIEAMMTAGAAANALSPEDLLEMAGHIESLSDEDKALLLQTLPTWAQVGVPGSSAPVKPTENK
jgi:hypothetical protein